MVRAKEHKRRTQSQDTNVEWQGFNEQMEKGMAKQSGLVCEQAGRAHTHEKFAVEVFCLKA